MLGQLARLRILQTKISRLKGVNDAGLVQHERTAVE